VEYGAIWDAFIATLRLSHAKIKEEEENIICYKNHIGVYTPKTDYKVISLKEDFGDLMWWWKKVWNFKCPSKSHVFMWLVLNNKNLGIIYRRGTSMVLEGIICVR